MDLLIVRENTEGLYVCTEWGDGDSAVALRVITRKATARIARVAFTLARKRRKLVTVVRKANVLKRTCGLFRSVALEVAREYPDVRVEEMLVDAMAMRLAVEPERRCSWGSASGGRMRRGGCGTAGDERRQLGRVRVRGGARGPAPARPVHRGQHGGGGRGHGGPLPPGRRCLAYLEGRAARPIAPVYPDSDARYAEAIEVDLGDLRPLLARPHSLGHPESEIYLANPAVAAASAVRGQIASPEEILGKGGG